MRKFLKTCLGIFGLVLLAAGLLTPLILCWVNPDMTDRRLLLEFWHVYLGCVVSGVLGAAAIISSGWLGE